MDREDRAKVDQAKDKLLQILSTLREVEAGYGQEARSTTDDEARRRAKANHGIIKRIIDLYEIASGQIDQINEQNVIINKLRMEIEQLKTELQSLKK